MVNKDKTNQNRPTDQPVTPEVNETTITDTDTADTDVIPSQTDLDEVANIEAQTDDKISTLQQKIKRLENEKKGALEELALVKADFLNARKRLEEDKVRGIERQQIKDIEALLPLCDSFCMAMSDTDTWNNVDETWRKGVEGIYSQLQQILARHSVTSFDPTGEAFDPNLHEAMGTTTSDHATDTVVETLQLGFKKGETVVRPAKVILSA